MKKFAKMSLVAALAVAGTTASAQPLAEAIKNVDVSGSVVYRYNDYNSENGDGTGGQNAKSNNYKVTVNLKSKVTDDLTANTSLEMQDGLTSLNTKKDGDANLDVVLSKANFAYTGIKNTTVIVGKQGIPTPWTVAYDADGAEHTGTGILALSTWGPVTVAGAYFNQTNLDTNNAKINNKTKINQFFTGAEDIMTVGIMANLGPVALDAWYLDLSDENQGKDLNGDTVAGNGNPDVSFDSYTVGANYKVEVSGLKLAFDARYTTLEFDEKTTGIALSNENEENELYELSLKAKMGMFGAAVAYGKTGDEGGLVALDNTAKTGMDGWNTNLNGVRDADMIKVNVNAQVMPQLNIALNYNEVDSDYKVNDEDTLDQEEIYAQLTYKMSKNFSTYIRYGQFTGQDDDGKDVDSDVGRLQVEYKF